MARAIEALEVSYIRRQCPPVAHLIRPQWIRLSDSIPEFHTGGTNITINKTLEFDSAEQLDAGRGASSKYPFLAKRIFSGDRNEMKWSSRRGGLFL